MGSIGDNEKCDLTTQTRSNTRALIGKPHYQPHREKCLSISVPVLSLQRPASAVAPRINREGRGDARAEPCDDDEDGKNVVEL